MDIKIQEFINILKNVDKENSRLKEIATFFQTNSPSLMLHGKFNGVDKGASKVFRCESWNSMNARIGLVFEASKIGIEDIFLPEIVLFHNDEYGFSSQEIVPLWGEEYDEEFEPEKILYGNQIALSYRLNQDYPEKYSDIWDFFEKYQIQGISGENAGIGIDNKIKIFDWFGNYVVKPNGEIYIDTRS